MKLRDLHAFDAVARNGRIAPAARELSISSTILTRQIAALEDELGISLFHRHGRRLVLTVAGADLHSYVQQILQLVTGARMVADAHRGLLCGTLRMAVEPNVAVLMLPTLLAGFNVRYPRLTISLSEVDRTQIREGLVKGEYDVGLMSNPLPDPALDISIVYEDDLVLAAANHHPLSRRQSVRLQEIADAAWIVADPLNGLTQQILAVCRDHGVQPRIVLQGGNLATTLQAVAAGIGISLLPERIVEQAIGIRGVPLQQTRLRTELAVVTAATLQPNPAVRMLAAHLLKQPGAAQDDSEPPTVPNE
jgi:DNA-binding transcriptional LysR family regulator